MPGGKGSKQVQLDERKATRGAVTATPGGVGVNHNFISLQGKEPIIWQLYAVHFSGRLIT